jgi:hypothetical protein
MRGGAARERAGARPRERGAALVEAAIVLPLVLLLVFGSIEFGFAFSEQGSLRGATRAGARAAAAVPKGEAATFAGAALGALDPTLDEVQSDEAIEIWLYEAVDPDGDGNFERPTTCASNCMRYVHDGTTAVRAGGNDWLPGERYACVPPGAGRDGPDRVGVWVRVVHQYVTGIPLSVTLSDTVTLTANTIMTLEPDPTAACGES